MKRNHHTIEDDILYKCACIHIWRLLNSCVLPAHPTTQGLYIFYRFWGIFLIKEWPGHKKSARRRRAGSISGHTKEKFFEHFISSYKSHV